MARAAGKGCAGAVIVAAFLLLAVPARAQDDLAIRGSVDGRLARGGRVRFEVTATHPDGWQALHRVGVVLELHGAVLEEMTYDVDDTSIDVGGNRAVAGTGNVAVGRFFRVGAFGLEVGTGADRLRLGFEAAVLAAPPTGARFRFLAEDDQGTDASRTVDAAVEPEQGGLSVGVMAAAVVAALVAGGYLGSRLAGRRRSGPSVYATVARRLHESERPPPGREPR